MYKGERVWYVVDENTKTVYLTHVATGHPNTTK